ncbi:sensor histidine kinase [Janibacter melonis]|uniref:sensor histidine kinase n=1 Tax=Janibacter melonis TaxID=262209 RepID=UPI001785D677
MRRRMLLVSLALVGAMLVALMTPLALTHAAERTQDLFAERLSDTTRFAVLAEDALEEDTFTGLSADLERYTQVYGGSVVVVNANREVVARSGDGRDDPRVAAATAEALDGAAAQPPPTAWPWREDSVVIGSPVGRDSQVLGAVVMSAPTDRVHDDLSRGILWLTLLGLVSLLLTSYGVVIPFVGWVLRPVRRLDEAAVRLSDGDLTSRATEDGPPELRHLARSFNVMVDSVEASQRQQRELVADAAHQLGNPLTALRLRAEGLAEEGAEPGSVGLVLEEADRLSATVESLLHLSQVGAVPVTPTPLDVAQVVRGRCEMWAPVFDPFDVDVPAQALALATPEVLDVALDALLDNAAKFAAGSLVRVAVDEVSDPEGRWVRVDVRDHGAGLHPEDVAKVGARFFRGRTHQNVAGTGLGLAIVQARLADVGGRMHVTAPESGGLSVVLLLRAAG